MELEKEYSCLDENRLILKKSVNVDKNYQETLEAYIDDIYKVVKCTSHSYVVSCDIKDGNIIACGKTEIFVTYYNEQNELIYTDFIEDFEELISVDSLSEYAFSIAKIFDKYCNYRIINQRRIDVHTSFSISLLVYDKYSCPVLSNCEKSKLKIINKKVSQIENYVQSKLDIDESFDLPTNSNGIKRVISYSINTLPSDIKAINDKVLVKLHSIAQFVYTNDNNDLDKAEYSFECSKIIDVPGVSENSHCLVDICEGSMFTKAKSAIDDNGGKIDIYGDIYIQITVICEKELSLVTDGYVINKKCRNNYLKYNLCCDGKYISKKVDEKLSIKLNSQIIRIVDCSIMVLNRYIKHNKLFIDLQSDFIVENDKNSIEYCSSTNTIEYELSGDNCIANSVFISNFDYNIVSDNLVTVNICLFITSYSSISKMFNLLSDIEAEENIKNPALTIYFAKNEEKIWDIAKLFSTDAELIKSHNDLNADILDSNKVLIIPGL